MKEKKTARKVFGKEQGLGESPTIRRYEKIASLKEEIASLEEAKKPWEILSKLIEKLKTDTREKLENAEMEPTLKTRVFDLLSEMLTLAEDGKNFYSYLRQLNEENIEEHLKKSINDLISIIEKAARLKPTTENRQDNTIQELRENKRKIIETCGSVLTAIAHISPEIPNK
ncbi:MAG: hypothetical protein ABH833_04505 [Parcubacteria group bacterium]